MWVQIWLLKTEVCGGRWGLRLRLLMVGAIQDYGLPSAHIPWLRKRRYLAQKVQIPKV